jgi:hypothetical protein
MEYLTPARLNVVRAGSFPVHTVGEGRCCITIPRPNGSSGRAEQKFFHFNY